MTIRFEAEGEFPAVKRKIQEERLIIYGDSLQSIRQWLYKNGEKKFVFTGTDTARIYTGKFEKTRHAKSETHDGMKVRHQGWGKGTLGVPGLGGGIKRIMKVTGAINTKYFIGVSVTKYKSKNPKFMHHQKSVRRTGIFRSNGAGENKPFTLQQLRQRSL